MAASNIFITVCPANVGSGSSNGSRLLNQWNQGIGTLADIGTGAGAPVLSLLSSTQGTSNSTERWTSYRVIRCGLRIIPTSNFQTKSGVWTICQVPGFDYSYGSTNIPFPTLTQML